MKKNISLLLVYLLVYVYGFSQQGDVKKAQEYISVNNFEEALSEFLLLLKDNPDDIKNNYRAAVCYLNLNGDKSRAIPNLEKVIENSSEDNNAYYLLGRAYHYGHQFDKAVEVYKKYKEIGGGTAASTQEVDMQIQYCYNAKELVKYPLNVSFENLGKNVNSVFADYYPFVPVNESFLVFNSKRDEYSEYISNGSWASNVYISKVENGIYSKANPLGENINTVYGNEEVIGLSANGDIMLLMLDNKNSSGDLFLTNKMGESFEKPVKLDESINSKDYEISASISRDGNVIYFASNRKGGLGGTDIYVSRKLPIGGWGPPQNLGPDINTEFDEDFPNISADGRILYFSSKGHTSMGGYDIFQATWNNDAKKFENARNIGSPINTTYDDMNLRMSETGRYGYIAAVRKEGFGDYDIYRVTLNEVEARLSVIKGYIRSNNPDKSIEDIIIDVTDKKTGDLIGSYLPNFNTMKYVVILPPGEYTMTVDAEGHKTHEEDIVILDKSSFEAEIDKDIMVVPN